MLRHRLLMLFRFLLALSIAGAPMLPAFASSKADAGQHAGHEQSDAGTTVPGDPAKPHSGKHDFCNGNCCLACGMSVLDVSLDWGKAIHARSVLTPTVGHYHPHPIVTVPHRPPRARS
jgi:hypothetical protein